MAGEWAEILFSLPGHFRPQASLEERNAKGEDCDGRTRQAMNVMTWLALFAVINAARVGVDSQKGDWLDMGISLSLVALTVLGIYLVERDDE